MLWASARSIRHKLLLVVVTTTLTALIVACLTMEGYDLSTYKQSSVNDLLTQADIIGRASTSALAFDDPRVAHENLLMLKAAPRIRAAAIYNSKGALFSSYTQDETTLPQFPSFPEVKDVQIEGKELVVSKRIVQNGETLGTVYLRARYELFERFKSYVGILCIVMLISLLAAIILSYRLNTAVTEPILEIGRVVHKVMKSRDFSLRAKKTTQDEIGALADEFNKMLAEIGRAEDALRTADRQKDEFLATLAHELRNPLAPIRHAASISRMPNATEEQLKRAQKIIERQVAHMSRLLDDLLEVSRITRGKLELRKERLKLKDSLLAAVETVRPLIESRGHILTMEVPSESIYVNADPVRLEQIFSNLLSNAAKYTDAGGQIRVQAELGKENVIVTVQDNGIGISPELLPQLFEMFSQATTALERSEGGLGIGLSLARGLMLLHGGTIEARSPGLGKGSEFIITLPLAHVEPTGNPEPASPTGAPVIDPKRLRVLVADDNQDNADSCTMLLQMSGHEVRTAYSGGEALLITSKFDPQVIILDIGMPDMNGYQVAGQIRAAKGGEAIVLIAVTGWGQTEDKRKALAAGFDHHLTKPVDFEALQTLIAQYGDTKWATKK
jgi:signal transduction histidine kinase/CheY-like chemotaxis protein